jgi:hypothetical protein
MAGHFPDRPAVTYHRKTLRGGQYRPLIAGELAVEIVVPDEDPRLGEGVGAPGLSALGLGPQHCGVRNRATSPSPLHTSITGYTSEIVETSSMDGYWIQNHF